MTSFGHRKKISWHNIFWAFSGCSEEIVYYNILAIQCSILIFSKNIMIQIMFTNATEIMYVENNPRNDLRQL